MKQFNQSDIPIQAMRAPKVWTTRSYDERKKIFEDLDYAFPDILAKRLWFKLPKSVRENYKAAITNIQ